MKRGGLVLMPPVNLNSEKPTQWMTALEVFQELYQVELMNTHNFETNVKTARIEEDEATALLMADFLKMQYDEVEKWEVILAKAKTYGERTGLIWHLDKELG